MAGGLLPSGGGDDADGLPPVADINITPLVDVMLVLLIIFMVAAPMLVAGVPVELPSSQAAQITPPAPPITVSVDAQGQVFLDHEPLPKELLSARLKALAAADKTRPVYVRGDKNLSYGVIADLMGQVGASGFNRVALLTEQPRP
ncbi:ExbD/TolR family protein [Elstera cyanobacteriorum]|uniref:ExbD/TolR family protein n=1 Tax=Elstera cyanobacteriorum TaxID=2022747 RepID=UPI002354C9B5|nr:biopolymer transporter ExbD [Elstera cyanobacteriorum]MCK6442496.1 biopolymer transporter ExbD [Elstera cyanobacteriorum]